jgi:hypothetical protein
VFVLTGIKTQVLHADEESYRAVAASAERVVQRVKDRYANEFVPTRDINARAGQEPDPVEIQGLLDRFSKDQADIELLDERAARLIGRSIMVARSGATPGPVGWRLPELTAVAHAQAAAQQGPPRVSAGLLAVLGTGTCTSTFGAREYARFDARRRLALQLEPSARAERLDAVIAAVDGAAADAWNRVTPGTGGFVTNTSQVTLNRVLAQSTLQKARSGPRPAVRFTAVVQVPAAFSGRLTARTVPKISEGDFAFTFQVSRAGTTLRAELAEISILNDSSIGSTRWSFDVLGDGRRLFAVPMHRFDDSGGRSTVCRPQADEGLNGSVTLARTGPVELKVLGYKPS